MIKKYFIVLFDEIMSPFFPLLSSLLVMAGIMTIMHWLAPVVEKENRPNLVSMNDTIEYCDKDSHKVVETITDIRFKILNRNNIVYLTTEQDKEILVYDSIPENCYVNIIIRSKNNGN